MCPGAKPKDKRAFTCAELEAEAKAPGGRTLLAVDGKVLDLTRFKVHHPGGAVVLENVAGRDVTDAFVAFHPPQTIKQINSFVVGELIDLGLDLGLVRHLSGAARNRDRCARRTRRSKGRASGRESRREVHLRQTTHT